MIDVVFNHTSPDALWVSEHPEWYYRDKEGNMAPSNPHWSDIVDLDYTNTNSGLWEALIEVLCYWVEVGVDGFRCDVASIIPLDFWKRAKKEVKKIKAGVIWLAESWHAKIIETRRKQNLYVNTVSELYEVFDITYDYEFFPMFRKVLSGKVDVLSYLGMLRFQNTIYPTNFSKLRFVENHDTGRIFASAKSHNAAMAWTAFTSFNHGAFLIYSGLESKAIKSPSKFDIDKIKWDDYELQPFITLLSLLKKKQVVVVFSPY